MLGDVSERPPAQPDSANTCTAAARMASRFASLSAEIRYRAVPVRRCMGAASAVSRRFRDGLRSLARRSRPRGRRRHASGATSYSRSEIARGLFGAELDRQSRAGGWGITSNLSHPGVAPTNLLAARPEVGWYETDPALQVHQRPVCPRHPVRYRRDRETPGLVCRDRTRRAGRAALRTQRPRSPEWSPAEQKLGHRRRSPRLADLPGTDRGRHSGRLDQPAALRATVDRRIPRRSRRPSWIRRGRRCTAGCSPVPRTN